MHFSKHAPNRGRQIYKRLQECRQPPFEVKISAVEAEMMEKALLGPDLLSAGLFETIKGHTEARAKSVEQSA
jgi:hypothetical protein